MLRGDIAPGLQYGPSDFYLASGLAGLANFGFHHDDFVEEAITLFSLIGYDPVRLDGLLWHPSCTQMVEQRRCNSSHRRSFVRASISQAVRFSTHSVLRNLSPRSFRAALALLHDMRMIYISPGSDLMHRSEVSEAATPISQLVDFRPDTSYEVELDVRLPSSRIHFAPTNSSS